MKCKSTTNLGLTKASFAAMLLVGCGGDDGPAGADETQKQDAAAAHEHEGEHEHDAGTETEDPAGRLALTIPFSVTVAERPLRCGELYDDVGSAGSTIEARDVRFYVHDVALGDGDGKFVPLELDDDGRFQRDGLALLDFTDASSAACADRATEEVHTFISRVLPKGTYTQLRFQVGVPSDLNHLNAPVQPPPLNSPGMWWSWSAGFRHAKIDVTATTGDVVKERFAFHSGAIGCTADEIAGPYTCERDLIASVELSFSPEDDAVELDLARLFGDTDLSVGRCRCRTSSTEIEARNPG